MARLPRAVVKMALRIRRESMPPTAMSGHVTAMFLMGQKRSSPLLISM
jgi:hypothetical protein